MKNAVLCLLFLPSMAWAAGSQPVLTGVEKPVAVKTGVQTDPHISGSNVVFTDLASGSADVWYADLTTGAQYAIAGGEGDQSNPRLFGGDVSYIDWSAGYGEIVLYNIAQGTKTYLGNNGQEGAAVSERLLTWEDLSRVDNRGEHFDIVVQDRLAATTTRLTSTGENYQPAASGANLVYTSDLSTSDLSIDPSIKLYNADTLLTTTLFAGPARYADIDGDHVVLSDYSRGVVDVGVFNLSGLRLATLTLSEDVPSHISGEWVSFADYSSGIAHVGLWHWTTGDVYSIGQLTSRQQLNSISGNRVVYTDDRSGDLDIYVYEFTLTSADTTPPVLSVPADIVVNATSPSGATVNFVVTATDDVDPHPAVTCDHLSGRTYPIGSNTVRCTATDTSGNSSSKSFLIIVRGLPTRLATLQLWSTASM